MNIYLYPTVLPNSPIRLNSFLVKPIWFSMYTIMSSVNNDSFTLSFKSNYLENAKSTKENIIIFLL